MKLQITCKQATEFIIKKEEGKLTLKKHVQLWLHMGVCGLCKLFASQSRFISKNSEHLHEHLAESLSAADKEQMITTLEQQ